MSGLGLSRLAPMTLSLVLAVGLTACGTDEAAPDEDSAAITVTREGDSFTPNGERVELAVDQTLVLTVTSDQAGELHVHSTPEQEVVYDAGTSDHEITIDRPGVVEVESHEPDLVLLQLEVR